MKQWKCASCGRSNEAVFDMCWQCGTRADGSPADPDFVREEVAPTMRQRELDCLRCSGPMASMGELKLHEGSRALPFLLGDWGELLVNRACLDAFACESCGRVELFVPDAGR